MLSGSFTVSFVGDTIFEQNIKFGQIQGDHNFPTSVSISKQKTLITDHEKSKNLLYVLLYVMFSRKIDGLGEIGHEKCFIFAQKFTLLKSLLQLLRWRKLKNSFSSKNSRAITLLCLLSSFLITEFIALETITFSRNNVYLLLFSSFHSIQNF